MNLGRLVSRSLVHYRRTGAVVVFGLAIASAVITGSLVIGDSVKGSLRDTALSRLGRIDYALRAPRHFRTALADELMSDPQVSSAVDGVFAAMATVGAARDPQSGAVVPDVSVLGVEAGYLSLQQGGVGELQGRQCAINRALADDLGVGEGEPLLLTVHKESAVSADTLFARRALSETAPSVRLQVRAVLPAGGVGDFRLDAQSAVPRNVFVARDWLASRLDAQGRANTLLVASRGGRAAEILSEGVSRHSTLADRGLVVEPNADRGYLSLTSDATLLTHEQSEAARSAGKLIGARTGRTSMYLATSISPLAPPEDGRRRELAYAVIAAVEPLEEFVALDGRPGPSSTSGIVLNEWAARDLEVSVGEWLRVEFMVPTQDGTYPIRRIRLKLEGIVELSGAAADSGLAPDFEGITNTERIDEWDPPFPLDLERITDRDEEYWERYGPAPKAFVSPDTARGMWQSAPGSAGETTRLPDEPHLRPEALSRRPDWITSIRITDAPSRSPQVLEGAFCQALLIGLPAENSGLVFRPVRSLALEAAKGTSDFAQLFLGLSMFLVVSGAGLAAMLMRLSVDRRASEAGIMLACGCGPGLVRRALMAEGIVLTALGTVAGVPAGVAYANWLIIALQTRWAGALGSTSSLWLHVTGRALAIGVVAGLIVGLGTVAWSVRALGKKTVLDLLAGWQSMAVAPAVLRRRSTGAVALAFSVTGGLLLALAAGAGIVAPEGAFFGIGAALLIVTLSACGVAMARAVRSSSANRSLAHLALRNAAAGRGRSLLVIGLLASATFVIVAVAANSRSFTAADLTDKNSGTGGFALVAKTSVPLGFDPGTPAGRSNLGVSPQDEGILKQASVICLLASPGEDISCLNISRPRHPRVLGVPDAMIQRGGFSLITDLRDGRASPWELLRQPAVDGAIPAFGDAASVRWTLHSGLGKTYELPGADGKPVKLRFVGLFTGSIFQSELLVSQSNFKALFPQVTLPSRFLIDLAGGSARGNAGDAVAEALRRSLGEMGLQVRRAPALLDDFIRVQNTYLSMFLALGGLGVLLGTIGLAAVLLRSALERRREMAVMLATGFTKGRLSALLLGENGALLGVGLLSGAASALVAVAPQLAASHSNVNWRALLAVLGSILLTGAITTVLAVYSAVRRDLVPALRSE